MALFHLLLWWPLLPRLKPFAMDRKPGLLLTISGVNSLPLTVGKVPPPPPRFETGNSMFSCYGMMNRRGRVGQEEEEGERRGKAGEERGCRKVCLDKDERSTDTE